MFNITGNKWIDWTFIAIMAFGMIGTMVEFYNIQGA